MLSRATARSALRDSYNERRAQRDEENRDAENDRARQQRAPRRLQYSLVNP